MFYQKTSYSDLLYTNFKSIKFGTAKCINKYQKAKLCLYKLDCNSILQYYFLRNQHQNFGGKLTKVRVGGWLLMCAQNLNAGFVKPTIYNICSYILFNVFD